MQHVRAVVFDAYGTLLDIHAAMGRHAARLGPNWQQISADWRAKQVEYSWVRSLAGPGHHRDFWHLTEEALVWAARWSGGRGAQAGHQGCQPTHQAEDGLHRDSERSYEKDKS